jgi:transposase
MEPQTVGNTYKCRLYPTPELEQALDTILWRCRALYNVALEERKSAWERCSVSLNYYHQANTRRTRRRTAKPRAPNIVRSIPPYYKLCCGVWK